MDFIHDNLVRAGMEENAENECIVAVFWLRA